MGMFDGLAASLSGNSFVPGLGQMYKDPSLTDKLGAWMKNNPEQVWMMMDSAGQAFDPNNSFAGIGTSNAQSSLMGKEQQAIDAGTKKDGSPLLSMLGDAIGGKMTAPEMAGPTKWTQTLNPDGTATHKFDITPKGVMDIPEPDYNLGRRNPK